MPKIRIKERDLTTNPLIGVNEQYILYVLNGEQQTIAKGWEDNKIDDTTAPREITADEAEKLEVGTNNKFLSEAIALGGKIIVAYDWNVALAYCGDRNQYDIKFILAKEANTFDRSVESTIEDAEEAAEQEEEAKEECTELKAALEIAETRKDCVVLYCKTNPNYTINLTESNLLKEKCNYIEVSSFFSDEVKQPVGKYVIPFYAINGIHKIDNKNTILNAHEAYVLAFLNNLNNGHAEWNAVAGATRGLIPGNYEVDGFLKESEIDNMQLRTYDENNLIAINPIVNMNPWGMRIWGNRTCLPNKNVLNESNEPSKTSDQLVASSFANVRILICDIKKALYKAARRCQFEQNSDVLWVNFTSQVNTLLEEMKQSYGIVGYRWTREATTERAKIKAILRIVPIEAVEDFDLTVELADSLEVTE